MDTSKLFESAWKRGWRDTKTGVSGFGFWVFQALGVVLGVAYEQEWFPPVWVFGVLFVRWLWATVSAPTRQRNEAREAFTSEQKDKQLAKSKITELEEQKGQLDADINNLERKLVIAGLPTINTMRAVISCSLNGSIELLKSEGITSVTDRGVGDFEFSLFDRIQPDLSKIVPLGVTPAFEVIDLNTQSFRIKFQTKNGAEPEKFSLMLEAPLAID